MTHDQFVCLVRRVERFAAQHPASYQRRLGLLAALGYVYPLFLFGALLGLLGVSAYYGLTAEELSGGGLEFALPGALLAWAIVRALRVGLPQPVGIPVLRREAPPLFAVIDEVCAAVRARRPSWVLITPDYNAFVSQGRRHGLLGAEVTYLALGLPYLQACSVAHFRFVLAHEIAHLSQGHGRFGARIWRLHATWEQLLAHLQARRRLGDFLLTRFAAWYGPYLAAYSVVARRTHETTADRFAAGAAGTKAAAEALAAGEVYGSFLQEEFWPGLYARAFSLPRPPEDAYEQLARAVRQSLPSGRAERWLLSALGPRTAPEDTHPALRDRLAALGSDGVAESEAARKALLPTVPPMSAAQELLGPLALRYTGTMSRMWAAAVAPHWAAHREELLRAEQQLTALATKAARGRLSEEEAWEHVRLTAERRGAAEAKSLLVAMHAVRPNHPRVNLVLGQCLLDLGDESGLPLVEQAMAAEPEFTMPGCAYLYHYLRRRGRNDEAERYRRRGARRHEKESDAEREAARFTARDEFAPHGLDETAVAAWRRRVAADPNIREAYLVQRRLRAETGGRPYYVLGLVPDLGGRHVDAGRISQLIVDRIMATGEASVAISPICLHGSHQFLAKKLRKVDGALLYRRGR